MKVVVVIPCYNEGTVLRRNVLATYNVLKGISKSFALVICDDNSSDSTRQIASALASEFRNIHYERFDNGPSRRENLAVTLRKADGDVIVYLDADLAVSPEYLPKLIDCIRDGYDVVVGSRYSTGAIVKRKLARGAISKLYNLFIQVYFNSKIRDHQCGFKAFRAPVIHRLIDEMGYDQTLRRGWFWDAELLIKAQRHRLKVKEIPVRWNFGKKSTFNFRRELKMIPYLLFLRLRL